MMAAFIIYILSKLNGLKPVQENALLTRYNHHLGLSFPSIQHLTLEEEDIKSFKEIFVIGDVHGCYNELRELMDIANVNGEDVLKLFVGDLVNKGPMNAEVLKFVRHMPACRSVRGNHDEIVLKVINDHESNANKTFPEKFLWLNNLTKDDVDFLKDLPYTISIPALNAIIVHAGLIPGVPLINISPYNLVNMRNIIIDDYFFEGGIKATKYDGFGEAWAPLWAGPQHVFFGHDAKRMLQCFPYATGLDTGCVYGNKLTGVFIYGPRKGSFCQVNAKEIYQSTEKKS